MTPLLGADGEVYAVSQGSLVVGGFAAEGLAETVTKGVPTSGRIPGGAIIERELPFVLANLESMKLSLRNPDFTTARRVARAINAFIGVSAARPIDPASVVIKVPANYEGEVVELITDIEQLRVEPDQIAKVVIDEQSDVIVWVRMCALTPSPLPKVTLRSGSKNPHKSLNHSYFLRLG